MSATLYRQYRAWAGNSRHQPVLSDSKIRLLVFSTLFPNNVSPHHGVFVEQRLRHLLSSGAVSVRVIAPVPWFPFRGPRFGVYGQYAGITTEEFRHGIMTTHPRYVVIPKFGMTAAPLLLALATLRSLHAAKRDEDFDIIDAHYLYPDGVAAVMLGKLLNKPVVITARGTDVNLIPDYYLPRRWILWAADQCRHMVTVSEALRQQLVSLGASAQRITTLRNGVDLDFFRPMGKREEIRKRLNIRGFTVLSVGHLIERKGHDHVIRALADLPNVNLVIAGDGELRQSLRNLAVSVGVSDRVHWAGLLSHQELVEYYNAVDALVLASSREGMPNVLLESLACGNPVVATPYWGNPEVVTDPVAGQLTEDRSAKSIVAALGRLRDDYPDRGATRKHAERFSWDATTQGQLGIFRDIVRGAQ
jgi:glycosyltransferase involved in cell wall biosynthesis